MGVLGQQVAGARYNGAIRENIVVGVCGDNAELERGRGGWLRVLPVTAITR